MKNNILVTGSHLSRTTWTGKIICEAKDVKYILEPFNLGINHYNSPLTYWYEYVSVDMNTTHQDKFVNYITSYYKHSKREYFKKLINSKNISEIHLLFYKYFKRKQSRYLLKDPIALMSAEYFFNKLDFDIIINIRHPAAFVASMKSKNWQFDFVNFYRQ